MNAKTDFFRIAPGMWVRSGLRQLSAVVAMAALAGEARAAVAAYNTNLVDNPGAEAQNGTALGANLSVTGWEDGSSTGQTLAGAVNTAATAQKFNAFAVRRPDSASGMPSEGQNYFWSGSSLVAHTVGNPALAQRISVASLPAVALGEITFDASAWFGGISNKDDSGYFHFTFLDANDVVLGSSTTLGGVTAAERDNLTNRWIQRTATGLVPAGTVSIQFALTFDPANPLSGAAGSAGVDNLSFVLRAPITAVPEPGSLALLLIALSKLFARRRMAAA